MTPRFGELPDLEEATAGRRDEFSPILRQHISLSREPETEISFKSSASSSSTTPEQCPSVRNKASMLFRIADSAIQIFAQRNILVAAL
jgi:hypothetical protein